MFRDSNMLPQVWGSEFQHSQVVFSLCKFYLVISKLLPLFLVICPLFAFHYKLENQQVLLPQYQLTNLEKCHLFFNTFPWQKKPSLFLYASLVPFSPCYILSTMQPWVDSITQIMLCHNQNISLQLCKFIIGKKNHKL